MDVLFTTKIAGYFCFYPQRKKGGTSGTIDNHTITLELGALPLSFKKHAVNILWHELIHLYFRDFTLMPLLKKYARKKNLIKKADEIIASALLPNGLLKQQLRLAPPKKLEAVQKFNARFQSNETISDVQKIIYPYLQKKKVIDDKLIKRLISIINNSK